MTKADLISRAEEEWRREREEAKKKYDRRVALINLLGDNPDSTLNELLEWATEPKTTTTTTKEATNRICESAVKAINDMRTSGLGEQARLMDTSYIRVSSNGAVAHA